MVRFAFPRLGKLPVSEVTSADVVETLRSVWHVRPATARRVRQRISTVMEWAVAMDYNPWLVHWHPFPFGIYHKLLYSNNLLSVSTSLNPSGRLAESATIPYIMQGCLQR